MPFILINKPVGPTSHDMINKLRKITGIKKIGHAGTLDPFAEGLLLVAIGRESTREISKFVGLDKKYLATLKLGVVSDTFDKTGKISILPFRRGGLRQQSEGGVVIGNDNHPALLPLGTHPSKGGDIPLIGLTKKEIAKTLKKFLGEQDQLPPMFSAKQINGKRLYQLARQGREVDRPTHKINVYKIKLIKYLPKKNELILEVSCSSGTYIRALAHDIGQALGTGAYLEKLIRTEIGKYKIKKAVKSEKLTVKNWEKFCF
ncbi:MAG: tRNA pseudouridine(55) synthase TruB [Patescibacteria group bacterium]|nr:tRNA pseudouridine(55) synthase TruB [Patescibacteria group bacterium]